MVKITQPKKRDFTFDYTPPLPGTPHAPPPPLTLGESLGVGLFLESLVRALTYVSYGGAYLATFRAAQRSMDALADTHILLDARLAGHSVVIAE
jgi:hypothetical protein